MKLRLGQPVQASDGPFGEIGDIIIDPVSKSVTHLVVEPHHRHQQARLVPIEIVAIDDDTVAVDADLATLRHFHQVADVDYVRIGQPIDLGPEWDVGTQRLLVDFGYGDAYATWTSAEFATVAFDRIPHGECEIRSLSQVRSSDGHRVGTVEGFLLTDDEKVSEVVVRAGRPGLRHYVPVSLDRVARVRTDAIDLDLDADAFGALPSADDVFGPDNPPSSLARMEHRAGSTAHRLVNRLANRLPKRPGDVRDRKAA